MTIVCFDYTFSKSVFLITLFLKKYFAILFKSIYFLEANFTLKEIFATGLSNAAVKIS